MGALGPLRGFLLLFQAFVPQSVVAYDPASRPDFLHDLGRELLGVHYEWLRGFTYLEKVPEMADGSDGSDLEVPEEVSDYSDEEVPETAEDVPRREIPYGSDGNDKEKYGRRLKKKAGVLKPRGNLTVPCLKVMGFSFIEPCGHVSVPSEGVNFTTAFGPYHVPGIKVFEGELASVDNAFSHYTLYVTGAILSLYIAYSLAFKCKRDSIKRRINGGFPSEQPDSTAKKEEQEEMDKERLNPDSEKFVCPGNIYRLVAVMHPGIIGYSNWSSYVLKAGMCAYMQLYLPYSIICHCLSTWHFNNAKSPIYFAYNGCSFLTQFAALSNVCCLFAGTCAQTIEGDALACIHLVQHGEPPEEEDKKVAEGEDNKVGAAPSSSAVAPLLTDKPGDVEAPSADALALKAMQIIPAPNATLLMIIEVLPCAVNMFVTCASSIMLMAAMFLKIATFQGDIMNISIIAVSLYFVFQLDDKVMASDPLLRPRYRRRVLMQTVKNDKTASWIKYMAHFTVFIMEHCLPFGLMGVVLISWRGGPDPAKPVVIGGDPFH